jgi:hypothetical protein
MGVGETDLRGVVADLGDGSYIRMEHNLSLREADSVRGNDVTLKRLFQWDGLHSAGSANVCEQCLKLLEQAGKRSI